MQEAALAGSEALLRASRDRGMHGGDGDAGAQQHSLQGARSGRQPDRAAPVL